MLDIIERVLGRVITCRIDGSTKEKERQSRVDDFNMSHSKVEVMLLSTKAAGKDFTRGFSERSLPIAVFLMNYI
jgi:SNF2 family DNA or RNA helicase